MFFFSSFFFGFWFWFLVFLLSRYSRGAWCFVGWFGVIYNMGKVFFCPRLDYRYMLPFLIDEMEGYGRAGGVRTLFAGNREPTEICPCWPRGGFFCFLWGWLVGSPTLPYLTFVVGTGTGR